MRLPPNAILAALFLATLLPAQERESLAPSERAKTAKLELLRQWSWGEDGAPKLFMTPAGPALYTLCFAADGAGIAVQTHDSAFVGDWKTGAFTALPLPPKEPSLCGPRAGGGFLAIGDGQLHHCAASAEPKPLRVELSERCDGFVSPFADRLLATGMTNYVVRTELVALDTGARKTLRPAQPNAHAGRVAWSPDDRHVAVAWALFTSTDRTDEGVQVLTPAGEVVRRLPPAAKGVRAMDFTADGRALTCVTDRIRQIDVATGTAIAAADGSPLFWAHVDKDLALAVEDAAVSLWDGARLLRARTIAIDEEPFAVRGGTRGPVLAAAVSTRRNLLAVATARGLRVWIVP